MGGNSVTQRAFKVDPKINIIVVKLKLYAGGNWDNEVFYVTGNGV